jgi:hypothetical protein
MACNDDEREKEREILYNEVQRLLQQPQSNCETSEVCSSMQGEDAAESLCMIAKVRRAR